MNASPFMSFRMRNALVLLTAIWLFSFVMNAHGYGTTSKVEGPTVSYYQGGYPTTTTGCASGSGTPPGSGWFTTRTEAVQSNAQCAARPFQGQGRTYVYSGCSETSSAWTCTTCTWSGTYLGDPISGSCSGVSGNIVPAAGPLQCPTNSLEGGGECICNLGFKPNASGVCTAYQCMPAGNYDASTRPDVEVSTADTHQCIAGCQVVARSVTPSPDGKLWAQWPYYSTGVDKLCGGGSGTAPLGDPLKPEDSTGSSTGEEAPLPCEAGQYSGQVNGVDKCIDAIGGDTVTSKDVVNADGTIDRATTRCVSGACVTTNERINADGTKTPGSTEIGATGVGAPGSTGGTGGGGGGGPEGEEACPEGSDRAGCMGLGELVAEGVQNVSPGLSISPVASMGAASSSCPAARTVSVAGMSLSFSWQPFCDLADGIRPVVVGLAWVTAIFGFMGIGRKDS